MVSYTTGPAHAPIPDDTDPWGLLPQTIRELAAAFDLWISTLKPLSGISRSTDQTVNDATETVVTFTSEDVDTLGGVDLATNNDRIIIPAGMGGLYAINARAKWNGGSAANSRQIRIRQNGSPIASNAIPPSTLGTSSISTAAIVPLAAGDYVNMAAWHNAGVAASVGAGGVGTGLIVVRL